MLAFINPALDPATAWQPRQAMNAVGSGRFIGKGFLQGTQIRLRSLPALWTDFPFAVWAEEWGFIGCVVLLTAYAVLVLWVLKIGREARDRFGITVCVGVAADAVLASRRQHRHGDRPAARGRRDPAPHQLRRLQRPHRRCRAWPGDERLRPPIFVFD